MLCFVIRFFYKLRRLLVMLISILIKFWFILARKQAEAIFNLSQLMFALYHGSVTACTFCDLQFNRAPRDIRQSGFCKLSKFKFLCLTFFAQYFWNETLLRLFFPVKHFYLVSNFYDLFLCKYLNISVKSLPKDSQHYIIRI